MLRNLGLALGLLAFGCANYGQESERIRSELIGMRGHALRRCLPVPAASETEGERERVIYRWQPATRDSGQFVEVYDLPDSPSIERRRRQREMRKFLLEGEPPDRLAFCQLTFELQGGLIRDVHPLGRDGDGLNANVLCLIQARACLPPPSPLPQQETE